MCAARQERGDDASVLTNPATYRLWPLKSQKNLHGKLVQQLDANIAPLNLRVEHLLSAIGSMNL